MLTTALWQVDKDMEGDDFDNWFENMKPERANNGVEKLNGRIPLYKYFAEVTGNDRLHIIVEVPATGEFEQLVAVTSFLIDSPVSVCHSLCDLAVPVLHHVNHLPFSPFISFIALLRRPHPPSISHCHLS